MRVRVRLFAIQRELVGSREVTLDLPDGVTASDLPPTIDAASIHGDRVRIETGDVEQDLERAVARVEVLHREQHVGAHAEVLLPAAWPRPRNDATTSGLSATSSGLPPAINVPDSRQYT